MTSKMVMRLEREALIDDIANRPFKTDGRSIWVRTPEVIACQRLCLGYFDSKWASAFNTQFGGGRGEATGLIQRLSDRLIQPHLDTERGHIMRDWRLIDQGPDGVEPHHLGDYDVRVSRYPMAATVIVVERTDAPGAGVELLVSIEEGCPRVSISNDARGGSVSCHCIVSPAGIMVTPEPDGTPLTLCEEAGKPAVLLGRRPEPELGRPAAPKAKHASRHTSDLEP